ncbi:G2-specific serine/threonine protein kinase [Coccidioides posadasii str. Silveira]|uniref:non-specific serine/threonine protein kinase n=2 Tax=Coccidioides posadasii TaxID=199306 RepID=E9D4D0_COCPS|nr:G2-specific protein kinase nimA, putative [Coccidioides posadasii C735 delta SOWgp]EER29875.1 G2-specific protein kinase nimA, putative [Coccidioides posadasii C735 delta SOWgp]EFW18923.1 G2-specific protein kinase nimA [Coccidioides posadasii str. Silveira]QVM12501.1 G2-specific serine/threonine protein kinase [Coccidioides posadasii str. Silveira]|eukprot:XP_003072020.1 G2-specific protein kinase nimA, putative [Coccidioides posadasii C735 delta SOWgp]
MAIALAEADKYEILERIGSGSFGVIRKVRRKADGYILCRKEINYIKMSQKEREQLTTEFNILSSLRHPNIVAYYHREHLKATQDLYLYMEYCGGGDLSMIIKNLKANNKFAEEEYVWRVLSQLATALYRCHYGVDPPEVGSNVFGALPSTKPTGLKGKQAQVMILHRDLKPENIFLGADQSVKLGDFGLSKLMGSHDFASTYVGTPFYMSPEICAGEKYTLHSDIWAVGCIMYELCMREPPFNARTHMQLVQKIREGRYPSLPDLYSPELKSVIANCLRVNPDHRPDTAALLKLPVIRLMRKEKEVVDLEKALRSKEETALQKMKELELRCAQFDKEKAALKVDIENSVRREWEVKARLEIDRQVQMELETLRKRFEAEVQDRVAAELQRQRIIQSQPLQNEDDAVGSSTDVSRSSLGTDDTDFPSSTDLSSLSLESPTSDQTRAARKYNRTPFSRAKTTLESPMDVQMAEPSPMSIASLSLSPRRMHLGSTARNIFADNGRKVPKWDSTLLYSDDEDDIPDLPSPSRPQVKADPFKAPHRPLLRQNTTAMMQKLSTQPSLFPAKATTQSAQASSPTQSETRISEGRAKSPHRRLSKIPSCTSLALDGGSPVRRTAMKPPNSKANAGGEEMFKAVMQRNMGGRTLVELAQARAGGRPIEELKRPGETRFSTTGLATVKPVERDPPAIWDPEKDEMPSPFLVRGTKIIRNLR